MATFNIPADYNRGTIGTATIDIIHCKDGRFIHPKEIDELSTKPFDCEEGMMDKLRGDTDEQWLYCKLNDGRLVSIDTSDNFNLERTGHSSYSSKRNMTEVFVNTWKMWKYSNDTTAN